MPLTHRAVGDFVKIRTLDSMIEQYGESTSPDTLVNNKDFPAPMADFCGRSMKITAMDIEAAGAPQYWLDEEDGFFFEDWMFES